MSIPDKIRSLREAKGMSQDELAKRMGYKSRSSVQKIEKGERELTRSGVIKVAEIFGVTPGYIMGWDEISDTKRSEPPEGDPLDTRILELLLKLTDEERREVLGLIYERLHARGAI